MRKSHEPLSQSLAAMANPEVSHEFSLNEIIRRTDGRGLYLVMILLCLPFVSPVPVPGLSNIVGIIICILAIKLLRQHPPQLPRCFGERKLSLKTTQRFIAVTAKFVRCLEKLVKPRYMQLVSCKAIRWSTSIALFILGILLALPIPPVVPFSNSLPSWGIILLAFATMEKDGMMIWVGYVLAVTAFIYVGLITGVVISSLERMLSYTFQWG